MNRPLQQRGVVLVVVLWVLALLTVLLAAFTATVKVERQTAVTGMQVVQLRAAMDGVLNYLSAMQLAVPEIFGAMQGRRYELLLNDQVVAFRLVPEQAFIPLNALDAGELGRVLAGFGVPGADDLAQQLSVMREDSVEEESGKVVGGRFISSLTQLSRLLQVDIELLNPYARWLSFHGQHKKVVAGHVPEYVLSRLGLEADYAQGLEQAQAASENYRVQVEIISGLRSRQAEAVVSFDSSGYRLLHVNEYNVGFSLDGTE